MAVGGGLVALWGGLRELIKATGPYKMLLKAGYGVCEGGGVSWRAVQVGEKLFLKIFYFM